MGMDTPQGHSDNIRIVGDDIPADGSAQLDQQFAAFYRLCIQLDLAKE